MECLHQDNHAPQEVRNAYPDHTALRGSSTVTSHWRDTPQILGLRMGDDPIQRDAQTMDRKIRVR